MNETQKFTTSPGCDQDQQKLFSDVNAALALIGASPDELDRHFRTQMIDKAITLAESAPVTILNAYRNSMRHDANEFHKLDELLGDLGDIYADAEGFLTPAGVMQVKFQATPSAAEGVMPMMEDAFHAQNELFELIVKSLNQHVGRFQDYHSIAQIDRKGAFAINASKADVDPTIAPKEIETPNLLQQLAGRKSIFDKKGIHSQWHNDPIAGVTLETAEYPLYISDCLVRALAATAHEHGCDGDLVTKHFLPLLRKIDNRLDEIRGDNSYKQLPRHQPSIPLFKIPPMGFESPAPLLSGLLGGGKVSSQASAQLLDRTASKLPPKTIFKGPDSYSDQNSPDLDEPHKRFFTKLEGLQDACGLNANMMETTIRNRLITILLNAPIPADTQMRQALNRDYGAELPIIPLGRAGVPNSPMPRLLSQLKISVESVGNERKPELADQYNAQKMFTQIRAPLFNNFDQHFGFLDVDRPHTADTALDALEPLREELRTDDPALTIPFRPYDRTRSVFAEFRKGARKLHELGAQPIAIDWEHYRITFNSERDFVWHAIEQSALMTAQGNPAIDRKRLQKAIDETKAAFLEATISPAERAVQEATARQAKAATAAAQAAQAQQLWIQKQAAEDARRQREAADALKFVPFTFAGNTASVFDRGNGTAPLPTDGKKRAETERLRDIVGREMAPLKAALNKNFPPHKAFGEAIFASQTMKALDHICTGANTGMRGDAAPTAAEFRNILALALDTSPVHQANKDNHPKVLEALNNAPVLIVTALGNDLQIRQMKDIQGKLFPERGKKPEAEVAAELIRQRKELAGQLLQQHGMEIPESLQVPPAPPPPPPLPKANPSAPPPEPPVASPLDDIAPIITIVAVAAAMTDTPETPPAPTVPDAPAPPEPPASVKEPEFTHKAWNDIRQRAEDFVLEGIVENPPFNMLRCSLGFQPGHTILLQLSRWVEDGSTQPRAETRSLNLTLGEHDLEIALELKKRLQSHLLLEAPLVDYRRLHREGYSVAQESELLPSSAPITDQDGQIGKIIKRGGIYAVRLTFPDAQKDGQQTYTSVTIPLGTPQEEGLEEAKRRRDMVVGYLEERRDGYNLTAQDLRVILKNDIKLGKGTWQQATTIDLREHPDVQTTMNIQFPRSMGEPLTTLQVGNPIFEGSPNTYWRIPLTIRSRKLEDGQIVPACAVETSVNTHVSDPNIALSRIEEITEHFRNRLEHHARNHPDAHFSHNTNGGLIQMTADTLRDSTNVDWTRLDRIKDELTYQTQLSVMASAPQALPDGKLGFSLTVQRADQSEFREHTDENMHDTMVMRRRFTLPEGTSLDDAPKMIEAFRANTQRVFLNAVYDAYTPQLDPKFSNGFVLPENVVLSDRRKAMRLYNAQTVINAFDSSCRTGLLGQSDINADNTPPDHPVPDSVRDRFNAPLPAAAQIARQ